MKAGIVAALAAFALVIFIVPIIMRVSSRWKLYDFPGPLKIHRQPVSRLGGIAVTFAILGGAVLSIRFSATGEVPFFAAVVLICTVGAIDDIHGLSATVRLTAQVAAGALLWMNCGQLSILGSAPLGLAASCTLTVAMANSSNFLDGADGVATGVAGIVAIAYGLLAWSSSDRLAIAIAWAVAGSCAGFLFFNLPVARIFQGDAGSTSLGLCIASLGLRFYHSPLAKGPRLLFPLITVALPLLDLALAVVRRIRAGMSPFMGDRAHFYDLLRARGMSARAIVFTCYVITILFALIGTIAWRVDPATFYLLAAAAVGAFLIGAIRMGALQPDALETQQAPNALAEVHRSGEVS